MRLLIDAATVAVTSEKGVTVDEDALDALRALATAHEVTLHLAEPRAQLPLLRWFEAHGFGIAWMPWSVALRDADAAVTTRPERGRSAHVVAPLSLHALRSAVGA